MANYFATARSNYFRVVDAAALEDTLKHTGVSLQTHSVQKDHYCLLSETGEGWPYGFFDNSDHRTSPSKQPQDDQEEVDLNFHAHILPYIVEGEVVVFMEACAAKLRYVAGVAIAYHKTAQGLREVSLSLQDIYDMAYKTFEVTEGSITDCSY